MTGRSLLLALALIGVTSPDGAAQSAGACAQPLATVTAEEQGYARVDVAEFDGRAFLYVPEIRATSPGAFAPFQIWVLEGVYGRPFVESRGRMDQAAFERLRKSGNVRATAISVGRNGETGRATVARRPVVVVVNVSLSPRGTDTATVRICRGQ
jgi:hypothetical protein